MQYHLDCATLVLNAKKISTYVEHKQNNIGAFSTHVNDQKRSFSFVAHVACIFDSWEWRCCTELTQLFLPHCLTHMFCLHSQPSTHWLVRKYQEEEELWIVPLSLFLCVFSAGYSREVIGIRRDVIGLLVVDAVGEIPLPSLCSWSRFWSPREPWPLRHGRTSQA